MKPKFTTDIEKSPFDRVNGNVFSAWRVFCLVLALFCQPAVVFSQENPTSPPTAADTDGQGQEIAIDVRPFPRQFTQQGTEFSIYQPQYDSWQGNQLKGRFVLAVKTGTHTNAEGKTADDLAYGVVWFSARSQVDKGARAVVLTDLDFTKVNFPTDSANQDHFLTLVKEQLPASATLTVSLDHLESALAIESVETDIKSVEVRNDPPVIIFATSPTLLILVQGDPALRPTGYGDVERVINTSSLLLKKRGEYYTYFASHWAKSESLNGP